MGNRYKAAFELVLNNYPTWKRNAINEDLANKRHGSFVDDFVKCVITQAEAADLDTTLQKTVSKVKASKTDSVNIQK